MAALEGDAMTRTTIQYKDLSVRDPAPYGAAGAAWQANFKELADRIGPCNFTATVAPTANDDTGDGYATGSLWYDTVAKTLYWCASANAGAADWLPIQIPTVGTLATQAASAVAITGGTIAGITDLAVADGGTGAGDAATARTNLGLGTIATQAANSVNIDGGAIDGATIGGTTPGAGAFTTLTATGNATANGNRLVEALLESAVSTYIYAVEGQECNVYFDNMFLSAPKGAWEWDVTCAYGTQYENRWSYTPAAADAGTAAWSVAPLLGKYEATAESATVRISALTKGTGVSRKVLFIGDSTGAGPLPELVNLCDGDAMTVTLVGQHSLTANDSEAGSRTAAHESIGGWSWASTQATQSSESGDVASQLSGWTFSGHLASNTDNGLLYWRLTGPTTNLLDNPGFETAGGGPDIFAVWVEAPVSGTISDETTVVHGGSHAAKMLTGDDYIYPNLYQDVTVVPGESYTLSGYARGDGTNVGVYAIYDLTNAAYIGNHQRPAGEASAYAAFSATVTIPAGCVSVRIWFFGTLGGAGSYCYWDDIAWVRNPCVEVFKDSGATNLVALGGRSGDGVVSLVAQNSSGLGGSVTLAYTADDTTVSANILTMNFLVRDAAVGFDFSQYLTDTSATMASGDWVLIHLGINDVFSATTDAAVQTILDGLATNIDAVVGTGASPADTTIRGAVSGIRVGLCVTIPPSASQDAMGVNYTSAQSLWRYQRNLKLLQQWLIDTYDNATYTARNIHVLPYHVNLDTVNNMSTTATALNARNATTYAMQNNGVHPDTKGYWQMADSLFAFLKWWA